MTTTIGRVEDRDPMAADQPMGGRCIVSLNLSGLQSSKRSSNGMDAAAQRIFLSWPLDSHMLTLRSRAEQRDLDDALGSPSLHVTD
jgi:hypothetical protein